MMVISNWDQLQVNHNDPLEHIYLIKIVENVHHRQLQVDLFLRHFRL